MENLSPLSGKPGAWVSERNIAMLQWELNVVSCAVGLGGDISRIWTRKDKRTGQTQWDALNDLAFRGWELVDVTPIKLTGTTTELLYTFKRPLGS